MDKITVAIVDDHALFRKGLKAIVRNIVEVGNVYEANNGVELLELVKDKQPDIVLMDLKMPEMDGFEATDLLREKFPDVKVLIVTMYDDESFVVKLMKCGAKGYLLKNAEPDEVRRAILSVIDKGVYLNDRVTNIMMNELTESVLDPKQEKEKCKLSEREKEVVKLICKENTNIEIAKKMELSPKTIENYRNNIIEKIGAKNTAGIVMYAVKHDLI